MANAFAVRVYPHVWGSGVALAAGLQTDRDAARQPAEPQPDLQSAPLPIRGNPRLSELFDLDAREVRHHEALIVPV